LPAKEIASSWLAALQIGMQSLFVPPQTHSKRVEKFAVEQKIDLLVYQSSSAQIKLWLSTDSKHGGYLSFPQTFHKSAYASSKLAKDSSVVFFTSGTTNVPKGVRLGSAGLARHLTLYEEVFSYSSDKAILNGLPLHHTDGAFHGLMMALWTGATWLRPPVYSSRSSTHWLPLLGHDGVTHLIANPTLLALLIPFVERLEGGVARSLEYVISSAEILEDGLWRDSERIFQAPLVNVYGMTETSNGGLFATPDLGEQRIGSIGKPMDIEITIMDSGGNPVSSGSFGRLFVRGPSLFVGYEEHGHAVVTRKPDEWFETGDEARISDSGLVYISGRYDSSDNLSGVLTNPGEIESLLLELDEIENARVLLLPGRGGRTVTVAFIAHQALYRPDDIERKIKETFWSEKRPHHILYPNQLSGRSLSLYTASELEEIFTKYTSQLPSEKGSVVQSEDTETAVLNTAAKIFNCSVLDLSPDSRPKDVLGWDSFGLVQLIVDLEECFELEFAAEEIAEIDRLGDLISIVDSHLNNHL